MCDVNSENLDARREYHRRYQREVRLADAEKRMAYNAYQREYARKRRAKSKEGGE